MAWMKEYGELLVVSIEENKRTQRVGGIEKVFIGLCHVETNSCALEA